MKHYTQKEMTQILDSVNFPDKLSPMQSLTVLVWTVFNTKKLYIFCESIEKGKAIMFAFDDALNYKP